MMNLDDAKLSNTITNGRKGSIGANRAKDPTTLGAANSGDPLGYNSLIWTHSCKNFILNVESHVK